MSEVDSNLKNLDPIFIHSSFRTGSTWLWSKFRENQNTYCYYEIFNNILLSIDAETIQISSSTWNSHHPPGPPYFIEFGPLLKGSGIAGFDRDMAIDDFFLKASGDLDRLTKTRDYLLSLVDLAQSKGRVPVLSCTRSIGRVDVIRKLIGGSHILLKRKLFNQWISYSNQALNGNCFFLGQIVNSISVGTDEVFISLNKLFDSGIDLNNLSNYDYDNLLIAFLCLHLYLYAMHEDDFDLVLDFRIEQNNLSLDRAASEIRNLTSLDIDLSDYKETLAAPQKLVSDIDRVFSTVRTILAVGGPDEDTSTLADFVNNELYYFKMDFENYRNIAGSAHDHLDLMINNFSVQKAKYEEVEKLLEIANQNNMLLNSRLEESVCNAESLSHHLNEVKIFLAKERDKLQLAISKSSQSFDELLEKLQS